MYEPAKLNNVRSLCLYPYLSVDISCLFRDCTFITTLVLKPSIRGPFEKFVDWWQCGTLMQREPVTVIPSYCCGGNVVVA
jgi:hypothetical protein